MQLKLNLAILAFAIPAFAGELLPPIVVQDPANLIGGPVVVNAGSRSATVVWLTKTGEIGNTDDREKLRAMIRVNTKELRNLKPDTGYDYEFRASTPLRARFRTAPEQRKDFAFIVYGDTRTRDAVHQQVVDRIIKDDPAFVVHTGDMVSNGTKTDEWRVFLGIEKQLLGNTVLYPSPGNHERQAPQYFDFFAARSHYSFNWGGVHVAVLNSDIGAVPKERREEFWTEQKRWLDDDLASAAKADFRFVVLHHPPFSAMGRRGPNEQSRELIPTFEKRGVSIVFAGHDHNYQRHVKDGIQYIVTGGGGAPLYDADAPIPDITVKAIKAEHFVRMQVTGTKALITAVGLDGKELDRLEIQSGALRRAAGAN